MMRRLTLCTSLALILMASAASAGPGPSILLLNEPCGGSAEFFPTALGNLGYAFTETNDSATFEAALTGGTWDIVLVDEYADFITLGSTTLMAIRDYIAGGGHAYMNYWDWDATTAASFEASLGASYTAPLAVNLWDAGHPLFNSPNTIGPMTPTADTCDADGARFGATGGGVAIGGYTAGPMAGEAAVIVGNGGSTVLFGGILGLFGNDGLAFAENVVEYLVGQVPVELMEFHVE